MDSNKKGANIDLASFLFIGQCPYKLPADKISKTITQYFAL